MGQPFVGEVRCVGFNFGPAGWMSCAGQQLAIAEFETLYNLIGTTYGGDGQQTFNLPDLQGRTPIHMGTSRFGTNYVLGETGGVEAVTLNINQYPSHNHTLVASGNAANGNLAAGNVVGAGQPIYESGGAPTNPMNAAMLGGSGGNQPHGNMQPYLVLNWVISLFGIYPTPT